MSFIRPSVPEAVRTIILSNPHLYECMKMKVLNYNAVASAIKDSVEQIVGHEVSHNTIVAALVRFSNSLSSSPSPDMLKSLKNAKVSLITGVCDVTIDFPEGRHREFIRKISEILAEIETDFANIYQFPSFAKLILSSDAFDKFKNYFEEFSASYDLGYARISVKLPEDVENIGLIRDYIVERLGMEGIEMFDSFFAGREIVFIVPEEEATRTLEALRKSLKERP